MNTRRNFIKGTSAMVAGSLLLPQLANASLNQLTADPRPLGIQLYTATNFMEKTQKLFSLN